MRGVEDLATMLEILAVSGVPEARVRLTLHLARGLDVRTGCPVASIAAAPGASGSVTVTTRAGAAFSARRSGGPNAAGCTYGSSVASPS